RPPIFPPSSPEIRTMRRALVALVLALCLAGCGRSTPPTVIQNTTTDGDKDSGDPSLVMGKPVEYWIGELKNSDDEAASRAANFLAQAGAPAVPGLIEALKNDNEKVRTKAAVTLGRIGEPSVKPLVGAMKDEVVALIARDILVQRLPAPAVPELALALAESDPVVRRNAALALREIGPAADAA